MSGPPSRRLPVLSAWCATLLMAAVCSAPVALAQSTAQIAGSVSDATGLPLAGATVRLAGAAERVVQTDPDGEFTFDNLAEGAYEVTARKAEFAPASSSLRLAVGERKRVALTLSVHILEQALVTAAKTGESDVQTMAMAVTELPSEDLDRLQARTI